MRLPRRPHLYCLSADGWRGDEYLQGMTLQQQDEALESLLRLIAESPQPLRRLDAMAVDA